jgi:hypothetical protein
LEVRSITGKRVFRQGDCVVTPVNPSELGIHLTVGNTTSMSGETGELHTVRASKVIRKLDGEELIQVDQGEVGSVTHPQHPKLELSSGLYQKSHVRTYDEQREREVSD